MAKQKASPKARRKKSGAPSLRPVLRPIGIIHSLLISRKNAPRQGTDGAPSAYLDLDPAIKDALTGLAKGDEVILITWLHQGNRKTLQVHPRQDLSRPLAGVFATRSPDRPNPLGLHRVTILEITNTRLHVGPLEAIDGTPVVDIKPIRCDLHDS